MANGMEMMWKALGVDPQKMLEDFAKFNAALQSQVAELQALRADVKALRVENAELHSTIRGEFSELRSDLTSHTTALDRVSAHNLGDDNAARTRSEPADDSETLERANANGFGGDNRGNGTGEIPEIPGIGRSDGGMDA